MIGARGSRRDLRGLLLIVFGVLLGGCGRETGEGVGGCSTLGPRKMSVGCVKCHGKLLREVGNSLHAQALGEPTGAGLLGDFAVGELRLGGRMYRFGKAEGGEPWIEVEGEEGAFTRFEVAFTLGRFPLQQYLLRLDRGRFQVPRIAWDTRSKAQGGQRWFALGAALGSKDPLHWKGRFFNANGMCLECHVTGYRKGFDPENLSYASRWEEGGVRCAACHAERARGKKVLLPKVWRFAEGEAIAQLVGGARPSPDVELCAPCHARRVALVEGADPGEPFLQNYVPRLLEEPLYRPDGGIQDEVFVYGSFVQSRMYLAGVGCLDCHDPHSLRLRAEGNALCLRCHAAGVFDSPAHHLHRKGSEASSCVTCHMPQRTYMKIDPRRDHAFRVPRPDLAQAARSPSVCMRCHKEKGEAWAAQAVAKAHPRGRVAGGKGVMPFGPILAAARRGDPGAAAGLFRLLQDPQQAPIVRATALKQLQTLAPRLPPSAKAPILSLASEALGDTHPLVRRAALGGLGPLTPRLAPPFLRDPFRSVRIESARLLAGRGKGRGFEEALAEYIAFLDLNSDRPGAWLQRAILQTLRGGLSEAKASCRKALNVDPSFGPAAVNLADILRMEKKDQEGLGVLEAFRQSFPNQLIIWQAEVLALVRLKRLERATKLVESALQRFPEDPSLLLYQKLLRKK